MSTINWESELAMLPSQWKLTVVKDKRPLRNDWQNESPIDRQLVLSLLKGEISTETIQWTGIGLRAGDISEGLLVIDIDGPSAVAAYKELFGEIPTDTVAWTSGREQRMSLLFQVPYYNCDVMFNTKHPGDKNKNEYIEFLWNGKQAVLPPSKHPQTGSYRWINSPANCEVQPIPSIIFDYLKNKKEEKQKKVVSPPLPQLPYHYGAPSKNHFDYSSEVSEYEYAISYLESLAFYRADDWKCWIDVGMALHSVSDNLLDEWIRWSQQSSKFKSGECERLWKGFNSNKGIGIGTLGHYAKEDGWCSPFRSNQSSQPNDTASAPRYRPRRCNAPSKPVMELENSPLAEEMEVDSPQFRQAEAMVYRSLPPHLQEAEMEILGLLLLDQVPSIEVFSSIKEANVFYDKRHQVIYQTMLDLEAECLPTSYVSVLDRLEACSLLDKIGGKSYLLKLTNNQLRSLNERAVENTANLLLDKWLRRELIVAGNKVSYFGNKLDIPLEEILDESEKIVYAIRNLRPTRSTLSNAEVSTQAYQKLNNPNRIYCTGFAPLDDKLIGLEAETLTVLAARSSMGKTAAALQILLQIATIHNKHCAYFSLEMTKEQLEHRIWSLMSVHPFWKNKFQHVSGKRIRQHLAGIAPFNEEEAANISALAKEALDLNFSINDSRNITPTLIGSECRKLKSQHSNELGCVVIDYLQLFGEGAGDASERSNVLLGVTRYFYNLAQELQCPVILLAQVNRGPESRNDKRPSMSDLAQSGGVEWIADNIILLYRESYYNQEADDTLEFICAKVRQGETGTVRMGFDLNKQLVYDLKEVWHDPAIVDY